MCWSTASVSVLPHVDEESLLKGRDHPQCLRMMGRGTDVLPHYLALAVPAHGRVHPRESFPAVSEEILECMGRHVIPSMTMSSTALSILEACPSLE